MIAGHSIPRTTKLYEEPRERWSPPGPRPNGWPLRSGGLFGTVASLAGMLCVAGVAAEQAHAQQTSIPLFEATHVFDTGSPTSPTQAAPFASTSLVLDFAPGDTAIIASTPDGRGPIVVDNFMTVNDQNICLGVTGQQFPDSCFGPIIDPAEPTGVPIETVLTPIPPIDVSAFIPFGTTTVLVDLMDFGVIAGNSDLFLVTSARLAPPPVFAETFEETLALFSAQLRSTLIRTFQAEFARQVSGPVLANLRNRGIDENTIADVELQLRQTSADQSEAAAAALTSLVESPTVLSDLQEATDEQFQAPGLALGSVGAFRANLGRPRITLDQSIDNILVSGVDRGQVGFDWPGIEARLIFRPTGPTPVFAPSVEVKGEVKGEKGEQGKPAKVTGKAEAKVTSGAFTFTASAEASVNASGQTGASGMLSLTYRR